MLDAGPVADVAVTAEEAGWSGFAFTEHPIPSVKWIDAGGHQALDPFVALGHVAARTSRMRLLTFLAVVPYRNPFLLAKSAATVDKLSGGRFILGMGTGYLRSEFRALGVDFDTRNELFDEALELLPRHWSGEPFSYEGPRFVARDAVALPRPVQDPIPIWIGGNSKLTLRRVAERAQGWMPLVGPPELATTARTALVATNQDLAEKIAELRALAGDRADQLDVVVAYQDPTIMSPSEDVARHREALEELEKVGATWVMIAGRTTTERDTLAFLEAFGAAYI
jgi:probable F420-dependent oxidoreductase